jgi:DNA-binding transcriptional regulator YiaG
LPFCTGRLRACWQPAGYPSALSDLGDHLKKRRLDVGLTQREAAFQIGVHDQTFRNWETGTTAPAIQWWPGIIAFVGYDPRRTPDTLGGRLRHCREQLGLSQQSTALSIGVDAGTLRRWEKGERAPTGPNLASVHAFLASSISPDAGNE